MSTYQYPVITAHEPWKNHRCNYTPTMPTTATNQALLRPKLTKKTKSSIKGKGKGKEDIEQKAPLNRNKSSPSSALSSRSDLVDLVIEDTEAEETERVRARKEGGPGWNEVEGKRFIRTYPGENYGEEIRQGFDPTGVDTSMTGVAKGEPQEEHKEPEHRNANTNGQFEVGDDDETEDESRGGVQVGDESVWEDDVNGHGAENGFGGVGKGTSYGSLNEERNIWGRVE